MNYKKNEILRIFIAIVFAIGLLCLIVWVVDNKYYSMSDDASFSMDTVNNVPKIKKIPVPERNSIQCGGIAGLICPNSMKCKYDGNYPDAGGVCISGKE